MCRLAVMQVSLAPSTPARQIEQSESDIEAARQDHKANERGHAAAGQHPIIYLEHEERAGEHENVAQPADQAGGNEGATTGRERPGQFRRRIILSADEFRCATVHGPDLGAAWLVAISVSSIT